MSSVYLDSHPNENDLGKALASFVRRVSLDFGDIMFGGVGDTGDPICISLERKRVRDLVNSIIDGRLLYQCQKAISQGADKIIVIAEGEIKPDSDGKLMTKHGFRAAKSSAKFASSHASYLPIARPSRNFGSSWYTIEPSITYNHWDSYLSQLWRSCGVEVKRSLNVYETAAIIKSQWLLYQKPMSEHHSLKSIYQQPNPNGASLLRTPSLVRRVSKELPNVGWERSLAVEQRFKTVAEMTAASVDDWREIDGIGKTVANRVYQSLHSGEL